jgi:hypothetical protein
MRVSFPSRRQSTGKSQAIPPQNRLLFQPHHSVSAALRLRGERGEFPATYTKMSRILRRVLFHDLQVRCNPPKTFCDYGAVPMSKISHRLPIACPPGWGNLVFVSQSQELLTDDSTTTA